MSATLPLAAGLAVALVVATSPARAEAPNACLDTYEQTQSLRLAGKLREARKAAIVCARESCPKVTATECTRWVTEIDQRTPTVVIEAKSAEGAEVVDVRVSVDGEVVAGKLDGTAIAVDPGRHVFRYEASGSEPLSVPVVVREGEKVRRLSVQFAGEGAPERPIPTGAWVLGGASLAGFAFFGTFGAVGLSQRSSLSSCKPSCNPDDVHDLSRDFALADGGLVVGVALLAATTYVVLARPEVKARTPAKSSGALTPTVNGFVVRF